ncbi:MAG: hypothetical protein K6G24_09835 [Lachnospiraceae bacterium]|nr:hypothetical protein [Lachnospiraceae bacterium]
MRKVKVLGLAIIMAVFGLMAIGSGSDSSGSENKEITTSSSAESEGDTAESSVESSQEESESADEVSSSKADSPTIEEQILVENDSIKITAMDYEADSIWGDGIKLLLENNSSSDIGVGLDALIVNDYMITDLFSSTIAAGKKSNETLSLYNSQLKAAGINSVGKIEIYFHTFDPETYLTLDTFDCVTIKTSLYDSMDLTPDDSGQELYNEDGIRIVGKYVNEDSIWGTGILLYIENNSGENKIIQCDDLSVNGFMLTPFFSSTVYGGKKAISEITLLSTELEENNIESVDEVELKFNIIDEDFMNSKESGVIAFSTK